MPQLTLVMGWVRELVSPTSCSPNFCHSRQHNIVAPFKPNPCPVSYLSILWLWVGVAGLLGAPQVVRGAGPLVLLVVASILPPATRRTPLHPLLCRAGQHRLCEHRHVAQGGAVATIVRHSRSTHCLLQSVCYQGCTWGARMLMIHTVSPSPPRGGRVIISSLFP